MFNPYIIILGLFTTAGVVTSLWGCSVIIKARQSARWPSVAGKIEASATSSAMDDLLPDIRFSYTVADKNYEKTVEFPSDTSPTEEFSQDYAQRFPAGAQVAVYYNPAKPEQATLEPGLHPGDWMILAFGLATIALMGVTLLLDN